MGFLHQDPVRQNITGLLLGNEISRAIIGPSGRLFSPRGNDTFSFFYLFSDQERAQIIVCVAVKGPSFNRSARGLYLDRRVSPRVVAVGFVILLVDPLIEGRVFVSIHLFNQVETRVVAKPLVSPTARTPLALDFLNKIDVFLDLGVVGFGVPPAVCDKGFEHTVAQIHAVGSISPLRENRFVPDVIYPQANDPLLGVKLAGHVMGVIWVFVEVGGLCGVWIDNRYEVSSVVIIEDLVSLWVSYLFDPPSRVIEEKALSETAPHLLEVRTAVDEIDCVSIEIFDSIQSPIRVEQIAPLGFLPRKDKTAYELLLKKVFDTKASPKGSVFLPEKTQRPAVAIPYKDLIAQVRDR